MKLVLATFKGWASTRSTFSQTPSLILKTATPQQGWYIFPVVGFRKEDTVQMAPMNIVWFVIGGVALALGLIGVVLPILPTMPFIILAAFAFGKSAPRFATWLENTKTFGPAIRDWRANGAIAPRYKCLAIAMMVAAMLLSILAAVSPVILIVQALCLAAAASFILTRPNGPA